MSAPTQADVLWGQAQKLAEGGHASITISTTVEAVEAYALLAGLKVQEAEEIRVREGRLYRTVYAQRWGGAGCPSLMLIAQRDLGLLASEVQP